MFTFKIAYNPKLGNAKKINKQRKQISKLGYQANWELIIICGRVIYEIYMFECEIRKTILVKKTT